MAFSVMNNRFGTDDNNNNNNTLDFQRPENRFADLDLDLVLFALAVEEKRVFDQPMMIIRVSRLIAQPVFSVVYPQREISKPFFCLLFKKENNVQVW